MTDAQKEGIRGYVKTTMAYDFHGIIRTHDVTGAPIAVDIPRSDPPAPIGDEAPRSTPTSCSCWTKRKRISRTPGTTFSFKLTSGFTGFNTPTTFTLFNRALRARVDVDMGNYAAALTSLQGSFLNATAPTLTTLNAGVYHTFSAGAGDAHEFAVRSDRQPSPRAPLARDRRAAHGGWRAGRAIRPQGHAVDSANAQLA